MLKNVLCVVPYKKYSEGAKILAKKLGIFRLPDPGLARGGHHLINWGNTTWEVPVAAKVYNRPRNVAVAVNKLDTYKALRAAGVPTPDFTTDIAEAKAWAKKKGQVVLCRTKLLASGGRGIVVAKRSVDIVPAKVYTKYVRKSREYRVHIFEGRCIGYKRKIQRADVPVSNNLIRSHDNGWRYIVDAEHPPSANIINCAVHACRALGLDFGGVDVIWQEEGDQPYALEINTAPGLTDMTGDWYANAFKQKYGQ